MFSEEEKTFINKCIDNLEDYLDLLKGFGNIIIEKKGDSSIKRKFKVVAQEIFEIEQELKKYSAKVWKQKTTEVSKIENNDDYCFVVYSLLSDSNLLYTDGDDEFLLEKYIERMEMLKDTKKRFLSTSLVRNKLSVLFNNSHLAVIIRSS